MANVSRRSIKGICETLQVQRYIFFPACARRLTADEPSLLEQGRDEDEQQGMLASALKVLQQVSCLKCFLPNLEPVEPQSTCHKAQ